MDATSDLTKLKVPDLKKELKIRGLPTTGKRSELLERLQEALVAGVGLDGGADDDEDFDEDEILAGDDDDEDSKMTPMEEAAALAAAEKAMATPTRARRPSATGTATPRGSVKKPALKRSAALPTVTETAAKPAAVKLAVPAAAATAAAKPKPSPTKNSAAKSPAKTPAANEPANKIQKLDENADKENETEPVGKSALELRAERFGVTSDAIAKEKRAERFGVTSEETAKQKRAERFGVSTNGTAKPGKLSMDVGSVDVEKLKARAARFGETTAKTLTTAEIDEKKKARANRFGEAEAAKKDVTSDAVLAARAAKFATTTPAAEASEATTEPIISASGKTLITVGASSDEARKLKRAARFAS
ncbi:transcriptional regulatory protein AlgP [Hyalella azteca]|uniref:Transcriptional regulatory protein AlgP n=1 Tax=Hyalella azteca TaxID=294128 RepID=A0A8B7P5A1_HYAAZ|nr:transcriptional regulatory protein AlgP [Hyalella azteca]